MTEGQRDRRITRRTFIGGSAAVPLALVFASCDDDEPERAARAPTTGGTTTGTLPATPSCDDGDDPTPEQTEGPFFTPDSPERRSLLEPGTAGTRLVVAGRVLSTACEPLSGALLDFWQADDAGEYDNDGFRLRGHQFADRRGRFRVDTIVPGLYTGRTRHIHVKVQPRGGRVLTTQLYFPASPATPRTGSSSRSC